MTITPISPRRAFLLIAVFTGMVWAQLLPLVPAKVNGMVMPICTLFGVQNVIVSEDSSPARPPANSRLSCPLCILRDIAFYMPPDAPQISSSALAFGLVIYTRYTTFIFADFLTHSFQARAPPIL